MKIKELNFTCEEECYTAVTPIGRYFIDLNNGVYESYSDIEEIGSDSSLELAKERVKKHHELNILNCLV